MEYLKVGDLARDFALPDQDGKIIKLSEQYTKQNILLVFNIGFA